MGDKRLFKFTEMEEDEELPHTNSTVNNGIENMAYGGFSKTNSLPPNMGCRNWNTMLVSALSVAPEDLASQITLLDMDVFSVIKIDELLSCGWTKKNKQIVSPNVVEFTRRFNQVSFWTVQEILNGSTVKQRAETITHFIKVAKRLLDLNNLHSLFAIISALQSASIFRLGVTWSYVSKKDKQAFERLKDIFDDNDNWASLREYLHEAKLPCIPYLGLYLTDLVYIDMAHPVGSSHRMQKMDTVLVSIVHYQSSDYLHLYPLLQVQKYLKNVRYIEELQKFLEDDQYKLSLKLEPPSQPTSTNTSRESIRASDSAGSSSFSLSSSTRMFSGSLRVSTSSIQSKFLPGHRKSHSLGTNIPTEITNGVNSVGVNLIDDTLLESPGTSQNSVVQSQQQRKSLGKFSVEGSIKFEGMVRRKTMMKDGRKMSMSTWQRYWLQLWANNLVYFAPKSFKMSGARTDFKEEPCKMITLNCWHVLWLNDENPDMFQLVNSTTGCIYRFRVTSKCIALSWVANIEETISKISAPLPSNLMSFE